MYCKNCGKKLPDDARFCNSCGIKLSSGGQPPSGTENVQHTAGAGTAMKKEAKIAIICAATLVFIIIAVVLCTSAAEEAAAPPDKNGGIISGNSEPLFSNNGTHIITLQEYNRPAAPEVTADLYADDEFLNKDNDDDFMYKIYTNHVEVSGYIGGNKASIPSKFKDKPVTRIEEKAFMSNEDIERLTIPEGVLAIGDSAFQSCKNLISVKIPGSVVTIGARAFEDCFALSDVTLGYGIRELGEAAFGFSEIYYFGGPRGCPSLRNIDIPASVTSIGDYAFAYSGLTSITIPDSVTNYGAHAFAGCPDIRKATLSANAPELPFRMFYECSSLYEVLIPNGVEIIDSECFARCAMLTRVNIPEGVKEIKYGAFADTKWIETAPKAINGNRIKD